MDSEGSSSGPFHYLFAELGVKRPHHGILGCAVVPRRRPNCLPGRIPDMFDGQKRAARKARGKMQAVLGF